MNNLQLAIEKAAEALAREFNGNCSYPAPWIALMDDCSIANEKKLADWFAAIITEHLDGAVERDELVNYVVVKAIGFRAGVQACVEKVKALTEPDRLKLQFGTGATGQRCRDRIRFSNEIITELASLADSAPPVAAQQEDEDK